jgi:hypothetical protein
VRERDRRSWNGGFPKASHLGMPMFMRPPGWSLQMPYEDAESPPLPSAPTSPSVTLLSQRHTVPITFSIELAWKI